MTIPTVAIGLMLTALGVYGYTNATPDAEGKVSPTALIPAVFGGVLTLCGLVVAAAPGTRKHVMHLAAVVGLLGFLGGFAPIVRGYGKTGTVDPTKPAVQVGVAMSLISLCFVVLCVRSFIDARKSRQQTATV